MPSAARHAGRSRLLIDHRENAKAALKKAGALLYTETLAAHALIKNSQRVWTAAARLVELEEAPAKRLAVADSGT